MRGAVSGAIWGLVLGGAGLSVTSLMTDGQRPANQPQAPQSAPAEIAVPEQAPTPAPTEFEPALAEPAIDPVLQSGPVAPVAANPPDVVEPAEPAPQPVVEPAPVTQTNAPPVLAEVTVDDTQTGIRTVDAPRQATPETTVAREPGQVLPPIADAPPTVGVTATAPVAQQTSEIVTPVIEPIVSAAPEAPADDPAGPITAEPPVITAQAPDIVPEQVPTPVPAAPEVTDQSTAPTPIPSQVEDATAPASAARVFDLPQINSGDEPEGPADEPQTAPGNPSQDAAPEAAAVDTPALERFAAAFENPEGWPMVSVVLVDNGSGDAAALAALPFVATVIIDPLTRTAGDQMAAYRAAGMEIGLQVALPPGARAQDVEIAYEAAFKTLPEAVILYSGGNDLLRSDRTVTDQVIAVLAAEGMGLIAVERGLTSVERLATQAGVPVATVLRSLDGDDRGASMRTLDQAAFRARQGNGIVLVAPLSDDMLDILSDWARDAARNDIAIGPASAILMQP